MVHGLPDAMRVVFDDERAVANAGVLLPAMLADRPGIEALVDPTVDLGDRAGAAKPGRKVMSLVSAMALGADCIDDCDVLELRPSGFGDDDVLVDLLSRLPEAAADEIISRKTDYEKTYGSARLVYAASEPFAMAAIFIPPWLEPEVVGQTSAAYPAGPQYRRVLFGRLLDKARGVTFLDLYYTVDLWTRGT